MSLTKALLAITVLGTGICSGTADAGMEIEVYSEDFNDLNGWSEFVDASANLGSEWTFQSTNEGQARVRTWNVTRGGVLVLDDTTGNGVYSVSEAILEVSLSTVTNVKLSFDHYDADDEDHPMGTSVFTGSKNADGVSISSDGVNWFPIVNFNQSNNSWKSYSVDLTAFAASAASSLLDVTGTLQIKFQQYDNYQYNFDGRGFDNVRIKGELVSSSFTVPEPATASLFVMAIGGLAGSQTLKRRRCRSSQKS